MPVKFASKTGIVVPCYNESNRLDFKAITEFLRSEPDVSLLFVDDGSRDSTADLLSELVQQNPVQVSAWSLEVNCGKAEAVRRGILKAVELGYENIGFWDADLATPLTAIPDFIRVLEKRPEIDVVWGSRTQFLGRRVRRDRNRYILGRIYSNLSARASCVPVYDASCGAKLFRNNEYLAPVFQEKFSSRWIFDVEILSRLKRYLRRVENRDVNDALYELPVDQWSEVPGSKIRSGTFVRAFFELLNVAVKHRIEVYPQENLSLVNAQPVKMLELTASPILISINRAA
ncbi:glycosyltransferase [Planctomicrobium sp. SH527]|uniref:glycosyltransferase n=1 Tax=Planctomicrobium sp. SH527 TaxID=3448123 RepID=UPI003F5C4CDA